MKNIIDELTGYRIKIEKDGKEIVNMPGILALPGALIAPKASIIGTVAASLLGCSIHLQNEAGKTVDVAKAVKDAAETVADTAKTAVRTVREEIDKAWDDLSADDPEECPAGEENQDDEDTAAADEPAEDPEKHEADGIPTIVVEDPDKPE